jgi:hypothetical protein
MSAMKVIRRNRKEELMFNKDNTWKEKVAAWIGVSAAVIVALAVTHSGFCMIALLIPLMVGGQKKEGGRP